MLLRFHDLFIESAAEILDIVQLETGKSRHHAFEEVEDIAIQARYYAHSAEDHLPPRRRQGALPILTRTTELHHPRGVIGIIAPWNYPLSLSIGDAIPALLAGNAVVLKPDAQTPFTALWAAGAAGRGGTAGRSAGDRHRSRRRARHAAHRRRRLPHVHGLDHDRQDRGRPGRRAAQGLLHGAGRQEPAARAAGRPPREPRCAAPCAASRANSGQLCISIERLYVHTDLYDAFVPRLARALGDVRLGADLEFGLDMGSLASADQLAKISAHVDDAVGKGARVLAGGRARPDLGPYFYEPTLLAGVTEEMALCREETFGPVAAVYRCDSVDEMVERANDTLYGLNASVWAGSARAGRAVAARLQAGTVNVNEAYAASWGSADAPMGGFKESGMGRRHGAQGILKYTESQTIAEERLLGIDTPPLLNHGSTPP